MCTAGVSKTAVWRWQERFMQEGADGLLRDKTRPSRIPPKLTKRRLKRGVFKSIVDLQAAINRFLAETNDAPRPFTWTTNSDDIIAAVRRGHQALDSIH
jgi:hypothetical protein